MQSSSRALGAEGEARAAAYLKRRGWRILARNTRGAGVEIDLVATRAGVLAFVEVKTRRSRSAGAPEEAVDARKQARLVRGAAGWLREHRVHSRRLRFDVIVCEVQPGGWQIRHLQGAFDGNP